MFGIEFDTEEATDLQAVGKQLFTKPLSYASGLLKNHVFLIAWIYSNIFLVSGV